MQVITQKNGLGSVSTFLLYVLRRFPLARTTLGLTFIVLLLEYASISLMIPLAAANGAPGNNLVTATWIILATQMNLKPEIMTWVWLFVVLLGARSLVGYVHVLLTAYVSKQVHRQLSQDVCARVLISEPMDQVYKYSIGYYISLAGDDTFRAGSLINSFFLILANLFSAAAGLVLLFFFSHSIFAITVAFLTIAAAMVGIGVKSMLRANAGAVALSREAGTNFLESLNSLRSIRSLSAEPFMLSTYSSQIRSYTHLLFKVEGIKAGIKALPSFVALLTGIILLGPWLSDQISLAPEAVFAGTAILIRVFTSLGALMTSAGNFMVDARAAKDLGELTSSHENAMLKEDIEKKIVDTVPFTRVKLADVGYGYTDQKMVLHNLTYQFESGRTYAIIGPSGSGKSTLADLLLGLVKPNAGQIQLDNQAYDLQALRASVVLVEQQPRIFSVSIRENLLLGLHADDDALWAVLDIVDMNSLVRSMPRQLDSVLEYQGANLSGGQRQRLAIARSLLRNPNVLILDEATSALDSVTSDLVVSRIKHKLSHGILIFITHDRQIADFVDAVLEIEPLNLDSK